MKKYFVHLFAVGSLVLLLAGGVLAQQNLDNQIRANIPFDFYAGSTRLAAGLYTLYVNPDDHIVLLQQDSTGHAMFLNGFPADATENGTAYLSFNVVGSMHELQGVWSDIAAVGLIPAKTFAPNPIAVNQEDTQPSGR